MSSSSSSEPLNPGATRLAGAGPASSRQLLMSKAGAGGACTPDDQQMEHRRNSHHCQGFGGQGSHGPSALHAQLSSALASFVVCCDASCFLRSKRNPEQGLQVECISVGTGCLPEGSCRCSWKSEIRHVFTGSSHRLPSPHDRSLLHPLPALLAPLRTGHLQMPSPITCLERKGREEKASPALAGLLGFWVTWEGGRAPMRFHALSRW